MGITGNIIDVLGNKIMKSNCVVIYQSEPW